LTTNLDGHWKEFYNVFDKTLSELSLHVLIEKLNEQQRHRGTVESITGSFISSGFDVSRTFTDEFKMRFVDGSAFLNHHFIKLGWLGDWKSIIPEDKWKVVFSTLEKDLNLLATKESELSLTVPMAYIEFLKK
jgi:arsenite methyltransferase